VYKKFILLFLIYITPILGQNQVINITTSNVNISKSFFVYEDPTSKLSLQEVSQLQSSDYIPLNKDVFSTPFSSSSYWFYCQLDNPQDYNLPRIFVFDAPWLDYIQVNIISKDNKIISYQLGNTYAYNNRYINDNRINVNHIFKPGISRVFIQVKTRDPFIFSTSIMEETAVLKQIGNNAFYLGFLYGILLVMLLYNFFLFIGTKKRYYLFYSFYVLSFIFMHAAYNNYTYKFLFADSAQLQTWAQSFGIFTFSLAGLLFSKSFLNLKKYHPVLNNYSLYLMYFIILLSLASAVISGYRLHIILAVSFTILVSLYIFIIAIYARLQGNKSARFFILGSISGLVGTVITASSVVDLIPFKSFTYHALDVGMIIDAVLLSLALADKLRIAYAKKNKAEKDSKTDILTGLLNRRAYYEIAAKVSNLHQRYQHDTSVLLLDIDAFKDFNDQYGHAIGDKVLTHFAQSIQELIREEDYAFRLGGDEFLIILTNADKQKASLLGLRIKDELHKHPLDIDNKQLEITVSIGISQFQKEDLFISSVEKRADIALYEEKELS